MLKARGLVNPRGEPAEQHKLIEEFVQLVFVWVKHRGREVKQLCLHGVASNQLKMTVFRGKEFIVREDVQGPADWALGRAAKWGTSSG
jgi:hypothetical protein